MGFAGSVDAPSSEPADFLQQGNHISDSLGGGFAGVELVAELDEIALSLALSSDRRAFSLLIYSSLCSIAYCRTLVSIVGCQLAALWPSPERQRCKEFLLAAVSRRKRLPGCRHGYDPALAIKSKQDGSQQNPPTR